MTADEFLKWEKGAWGVDFKMEYVDLAGGDIEAGLLLSQIIFWFLPSKSGKSKMTIERDGRPWIAKKRADWWKETRLAQKRFDRAVTILEERGLVIKGDFHFRRVRMVHVTLDLGEFLRQLEALLERDSAKK